MSFDRFEQAPGEPAADLARRLAAYDDALASGQLPPLPPGSEEDLDLLHQLDGLRPRRPAAPAGPEAPGPAGEEGARYVLRGLRAVGGVGEIWLARDAELDRDVALKVLRPDRAADPACEARFLHEARVTARLQHPGIVPVYDLVPRPPRRRGTTSPPSTPCAWCRGGPSPRRRRTSTPAAPPARPARSTSTRC
jgi:hypothetical protein